MIAGVISIRSNLGDSEAAAYSTDRTFICSETGKSFDVELEPGMAWPVISPYSGKKTGYEASMCFWTASGELRKKPFPVLMNETVGKPGPTFCPDCGRLVSPDNPPPMPGVQPPPKKEEYKPPARTRQQ